MTDVRHPDLHPSPEILEMPRSRKASAQIELAQHTDGRWMWAVSWLEGGSGRGYCCGAKWGNFAATRAAALDAAIAEGLGQTETAHDACPSVRARLQTLFPAQGGMFRPLVRISGLHQIPALWLPCLFSLPDFVILA